MSIYVKNIKMTDIKQDFIFIICVLQLKENFKLMRMFKKILLSRKHLFTIIDAILMMYYLSLGLQCDTFISYISWYMKKINVFNNSPSTPPLLLTSG